MHQDGPSVSAKTPGRAVAYPLDVITLASHTTADKRRTSPLPGHHHDHTAASRSSSRKLAINTRYIEFWYNTKRLHSGLDYKSPQEALAEWTNEQEAA